MNHELPPQTVTAHYLEQRLPQFKGNPLIEALPPPMTDESLLEALTLMPDYDPAQRQWSASERLMMLGTLQNFMVPMLKHTELCRALDSMLRTGYVGRAPKTPGHAAIFQSIYQKQMAGQTFAQTANSRTPQISTALIGLSGMGKTTTVQRWCAHLPKVIFHPEYNLYQIPVLHVEMPSDGSSIKGLAHGILQKIDELIPGANYYDMYAQRGRTGADTLMRGVARVMNLHLVGLLICDEVQNLANSKKGSQTVMTELVSAANDLKVPILFIGTNKAAKVLGTDFRQSRRSSGQGIAPWDRLLPGTASAPSEWDVFLEILWQFQWVRNPVALDPLLSRYMFDCSQGVIDLAIKLFAAAQARAILDGTETLTAELILDVYGEEFQLLHPMVAALRDDNLELLNQFDDIAPLNLQQHLEAAQRKLNLLKSPLFSVKASDETFAPRLSAGLQAMGVGEEEATSLAGEVASTNPDANLATGIKRAAAALSKPQPVKARGKAGKGKVVEVPVNKFDERPNDYRRAIAHAQANNVTVLRQLKDFGMAPRLEDVIDL
ncbi:AAA family ATPase [Malikia spinosa]|uniref:AAA family ATPase n=1 Tax=Malikia spinosa TaxID=86180 RepID=A0A7C9J5Y6_9BURK|nr:AAA family ATPase [Malikia spinosa]MYZ50870.1 AAA family ATPase [Malikia spinosa]